MDNIGLCQYMYVWCICMYYNVIFCMECTCQSRSSQRTDLQCGYAPTDVSRCFQASNPGGRYSVSVGGAARRPLPPRRIGTATARSARPCAGGRTILLFNRNGIRSAGGVCSESVCVHTSRDILAHDKQTIFILENRFQLWDEATAKP